MKQSSSLTKHTLYSLCLACALLFASALQANANEAKPALEPLNALPLPTKQDTNINPEKAPFLLLAQAASNKAEAAQIAKAQHGGKVLNVRKTGNGWQVKLLLDDGRVKLVHVEGSGQDK